MKEDARVCQRCGFKWFAVRATKAPKPRWFDEAGTPWGSGTARVARLSNNYERSLADRDRWARCSNCGSIKVKTVSDRGFTPTAAEPIAPPPATPAPASGAQATGTENPAWGAIKRFMKVHWRIVLSIFCTIGVFVAPFNSDMPAGERVGPTILFFVGAVIFWVLFARHRASQRSSSDTEAPVSPAQVHRSLDMSIDDAWAAQLSTCRTKASVFNEVGTATSSGTVSSWLSDIAGDIDEKLAVADDLAALGRSLDPSFSGSGSPEHRAAAEAWSRLTLLSDGLDTAIESAAQIRLQSSNPQVDLQQVHQQLGMLRAQLPVLQHP